jgi:hypothetical protein
MSIQVKKLWVLFGRDIIHAARQCILHVPDHTPLHELIGFLESVTVVDISWERQRGKSSMEDLPSDAQLKHFSYRFPLPIFIPPNSSSSQSPGAGTIGQ